MGISIEVNNVLALREQGVAGLFGSETVPIKPAPGVSYAFIKKGHRVFPIEKTIPLLVTEGDRKFLRLVGFVKILGYTVVRNETYPIATEGFYEFIREATLIENDFYFSMQET